VRAAIGALALGALMAVSAGASERRVLSFSDLDAWHEDDHAAALEVFRTTCPLIDAPEWRPLCALAAEVSDARAFFELFFRPVLIEDGTPPLFTGYYEPELAGARVRTARFRHPIYRLPPEAAGGGLWLSRAEIEEGGHLAGRGLELAWLEDPVEVFFLQIQGSGRIRLRDGSVIRVGFAGRNGHPYRSVGVELARRGLASPSQVSAATIRNWVRANPGPGRELLRHNPSFVFFRELDAMSPALGPIGAMARPVTALRSVAVDPAFTPLGAPVWLEKDGAAPLRRLMVAQDTGGAITGAQRADIFFGTGEAAGEAAGRVRDGGRMVVLLPIEIADRDLPSGG